MRQQPDAGPMNLTPIAHVRSPYHQKFAIPRQANLVPQARGEVVFERDFADVNALRGIEQFSHLWILFVFHASAAGGWSAMVQPPRLGGRHRMGVFASRSGFRPNPIGLSAVENLGWERRGGRLRLHVGGLDLLDGTPVLDIKPYLPYADALPQACAGYAQDPPPALPVSFSPLAQRQIAALQASHPGLRDFISAVLSQDPRPAWRRQGEDRKRYGMTLQGVNIKWRPAGEGFEVLCLKALDGEDEGDFSDSLRKRT